MARRSDGLVSAIHQRKWIVTSLYLPGVATSSAAIQERLSQRCTLYIVKRTQLFLDNQLWEALHARARSEKTTISELVRVAARDRYLGRREVRMAAMQNFVGSRKSRAGAAESSQEVRELRRGSRLDHLGDR